MSLATRCTTCGTVFRVVQDQLKVSEGWVRCGRCNEVFNALEGLFDLERDTPPDWGPAPATAQPAPAAQAAPNVETFVEDESPPPEDDPTLIDKIDAQLLSPRRSESTSTPATRISQRDRLDFPDAQYDSNLLADDASEPDDLVEPVWKAEATVEPPPAPAAAPEFVRRAQREARWHSPGMHAALGGTSLVLLIVLALQAGHHFRDVAAARWPGLKPALVAWCDMASCSIEAPRRIEDVSVESTALTRGASPDAVKLSVSLRNRGTLSVALPSVDLSLTDDTGQLVARKILSPRDFRVASALMLPGAESALQVLLATGDARVTGYTVEIFYP